MCNIVQTELQFTSNGMGEYGMDIKSITVNAAEMPAVRGMQGAGGPTARQVQNGDVFGPECQVNISQKGKKLSRQHTADKSTQSAADVKMEKTLLRLQQETEQDKDIKDGYRRQLDEIDREIKALNSSYNKKKDRDETIEKQQKVLRAMRNLKEFQNEQSQRLEKEARQAAMQSAGYQDEIDENNRDLLTLLKTMEEAEKAEEKRENDGMSEGGDDSGSSASGTINSVSDVIKNSANHYMMSSAEREWDVQEAIADLGDEGRQRLKLADTITRDVLNATKNIRAAMEDELYTDEQIDDMMMLLMDGTTKPGFAEEYRRRGWKIGMQLVFDDVGKYRGWGLQNIQDAQEARIQHLGDNSARNAQETKKSMMQSALDAVLGEARQGSLDEASRELADEVKKLIDERNDVDRVPQDKEEVKQEQPEETEGEEQAGLQDKR